MMTRSKPFRPFIFFFGGGGRIQSHPVGFYFALFQSHESCEHVFLNVCWFRQIVLATNIAETAITVDDVAFVIDTGRMKETRFDPLK